MTEFERKLVALSPAAVDRDALLFAAGRASAPSPHALFWWKWTCGLLALTQLATVVLWLGGRPASPQPVELSPPATLPVPEPSPPDPSSYLALLRTWDQPTTVTPTTGTPDDPPLTAGSRSF